VIKKKCPKIAIGTVLERAGILYSACRQDKEELLRAGIAWEMVEKLPELIDKCACAQANVTIIREEYARTRRELDTFIDECREFRARFADEIRGRFRLEKIDCQVPGFKSHRYSVFTIAQDLNDLAVLYRQGKAFARVIPYDEKLENEAIDRALQLDHQIAHYRVHKKSAIDTALQERNGFFAELYSLMRDISIYGKRAFFDNPRKQNYSTIR